MGSVSPSRNLKELLGGFWPEMKVLLALAKYTALFKVGKENCKEREEGKERQSFQLTY